MKRSIFTIALLIILEVLTAQVQEQPELLVTGENSFKPYLYRRSLLFSPLPDMGDSLPAFVPYVSPEPEKQTEVQTIKHRCYMQFEGNVDYGFNSFISYYPSSSLINALTNTLDMRSPIPELLSIHNNLFLGALINPEFPLSLRIQNVSSQGDDYDNTMMDFNISYYRPYFELSETNFKDISAQLSYSYLYQKIAEVPYKRNYLNLYLASSMEIEPWDIKAKLLTKEGDAGIQIASLYQDEFKRFPKVGINLTADAYNVIPSIEFLYRYPVNGFGVFSLANEPLLESNDYLSFLEASPWIAFSDAHKLKKVPLNLITSLDYLYPEKLNFSLARLNLQNKLLYEVDSPVLINSVVYRIPSVRYTDIFSNQTTLDAFFKLDKLNMHQDIELDLAYLSKDNYERVPYRSLLNLDSRFSYNYDDWFFNLDILQHYFTKDHLGNDLPEAFVLNIGAEYNRDDSAIYVQLANLFNRKQWVFSEQPGRGRNFYLGVKHRF